MAYDQAILEAFTTYETACRFRDWTAHTMTASPEYRGPARTLGCTMVERATKALREAIDMGVAYEGPTPTTISPPAQDGAAEGSGR